MTSKKVDVCGNDHEDEEDGKSSDLTSVRLLPTAYTLESPAIVHSGQFHDKLRKTTTVKKILLLALLAQILTILTVPPWQCRWEQPKLLFSQPANSLPEDCNGCSKCH